MPLVATGVGFRDRLAHAIGRQRTERAGGTPVAAWLPAAGMNKRCPIDSIDDCVRPLAAAIAATETP